MVLLLALPLLLASAFSQQQNLQPAATGFDDQTNGAVTSDVFSSAEAQFSEVETATQNGVGPTFNAQSCRECHQNMVTGGASQISELRAGHLDEEGKFVAATVTLRDGSKIALRSLINQRAICPDAQEYVPDSETIRTTRLSLPLLGDGFVEAVPDDQLKAIAKNQASATDGRVHGEWIEVPILESPGTSGVGRFGWKDQHASLLSFAGDAYVNEMGISNRLFPTDFTLLCNPPGIVEPNNLQNDIDQFTQFMRALKAPPRDQTLAATPDAVAGLQLFRSIGCTTCHVESLSTAPPGTQINGGTFTLPDALGNKVFHPFGDFLLHNIGTGDGIVQAGGPETAHKLRTMPLWGTRTRPQKMHDGLSLTFENAIDRHKGEAANSAERFRDLNPRQRQALITFLKSL
jgi:CxxC motif-containing protein (DUF1111 family)